MEKRCRQCSAPNLIQALHCSACGSSFLVAPSHEQGQHCPDCEHPAPRDSRFCPGCGRPLLVLCPACGTVCLQTFRHCTGCGAPLLREELHAAAAADQEARQLAQRRAATPLQRYVRIEVLAAGALYTTAIGHLANGVRHFLKYQPEERASGILLLRNERDVLERLRHPRIVELLEAVEHFGGLYLIQPMHEAFAPVFPLTCLEALRLTREILFALEHLHAQGFIHGDVKPGNIVQGPDGRPILVDFNLAQPPGRPRWRGFTPLFAAPEQVLGETLSPATDLYALGMTLYFLFISERFPSILHIAGAAPTRAPGIFADRPPTISAPTLSPKTAIAGLPPPEKTWPPGTMLSLIHPTGIPEPLQPVEHHRLLGAKLHFVHRLAQVRQRNRDIHLADRILAIVDRATRLEPSERYTSAAEMAAEIDVLLEASAEEGSSEAHGHET